MNLDVNTLFMVTIYVEAILGLLLLFAWVQNTQITAVAWWGFAHLMRAASITLFGLYGSAPDLISIDLANALLFTAFAVTWTGARVFDGRPVEPVYLVTGAVIWLLVCRLPVMHDAVQVRALVASGIITAYTWLTAFEFWRGRSEQLVSRWPAIFMLFAHGALFLLRTPLVALLPWAPANDVYGSVWLTVLSFEALLFTISIAFILLAMAKERTEQRHRTAAMIDPLTGIANRRAFLQDATALAKQHRSSPRPTAVLLIDLDHFKSVNDRFGHAIGDRVLEIFAELGARVGALHRSHRPAGRRGVRRHPARHHRRAGGGRGRASARGLRQGGAGCRRPPGLRHRQHRRCALRWAGGGRVRAPGPGRPGALFRQGARPQPGGACLPRYGARGPPRRHGRHGDLGCRFGRQKRGLRAAGKRYIQPGTSFVGQRLKLHHPV